MFIQLIVMIPPVIENSFTKSVYKLISQLNVLLLEVTFENNITIVGILHTKTWCRQSFAMMKTFLHLTIFRG